MCMAQRGNDLGFAFKALRKILHIDQVGFDGFDGYVALHRVLPGEVDGSHAAFAYQPDNVVLPQVLPDEVCHATYSRQSQYEEISPAQVCHVRGLMSNPVGWIIGQDLYLYVTAHMITKFTTTGAKAKRNSGICLSL